MYLWQIYAEYVQNDDAHGIDETATMLCTFDRIRIACNILCIC